MSRYRLVRRKWGIVAAGCLVSFTMFAGTLAEAADDDSTAEHEAQHAMDAHVQADSAEHGDAAHDGEHGPSIGEGLSLLWVLPFVGILLSIAIGPLVAPHWWEHNYPKVTILWSLAFAVPFCIYLGTQSNLGGAIHEILHIYIVDYIPFIILLTGLFIAGGGIVVRGTVVGTPMVNTLFILIGALLASWIGTTGASMVMIRPLLRANRHRKHRVHIVVMFIFLVSNIGGALTPLGDPPLFLGFLHGVPFQWTLSLLPQMLFVIVLVLIVFYIIDARALRRETDLAPPSTEEHTPFSIAGTQNFIFLLGIMGAVLLSGIWRPGDVTVLGVHVSTSSLVRDALIVVITVLAFRATSPALREENVFTWEPIREVAILFAGIFMTIVAPIEILRAGENGALAFVISAADTEIAYLWLTGILSSFLDNAPTYLTFFNTALGKLHLAEEVVGDFLRQSPLPWFGAAAPDPKVVGQLLTDHADKLPHFASMSESQAITALSENLRRFEQFLKAISIGAVFMGANTYIGNAPNFMVRRIAIEDGVAMPSFFGYMAWSAAILIPIFVVVTVVFFVWM